jgi:outer membrane protein assembly factor BamE
MQGNKLVTMLSPYQMDIVQGNVVSKEQVAALKPGMSRLQVRAILGSPLITSVFRADRWEYAFTFQRQGQAPQGRKVSVFFNGDELDRVSADDLPSEAEFAASLDTNRQNVPVPQLEMSAPVTPASTPQTAATPAAALPPLPATYPPLEPPVR